MHAVSYRYAPENVYLVPENLIDKDFPGYTAVEVLPDMLTTRMIIMDATVPLSVFVRRENAGKITLPPEAAEPMRNLMIDPEVPILIHRDEP